MLSITVDRTSPVPLYFQIAEQLERAIDSGELAPGTRLSNEVGLAEQLAVSRPTLRQAIERLVDQGLVVRRRGVGTVIVPRRVKRPVALTSLYDDLAGARRAPSTAVQSVRTVPADHAAAAALSLTEGAPVLSIERVRFADSLPLAVMHNIVPAALVTITPADLKRHGLYELLRAAGVQPQMANQTIGARTATAAEARLLDCRRGATVLTMTRTAFDANGKAIEYGTHAYLAQRYSFEMSLFTR